MHRHPPGRHGRHWENWVRADVDAANARLAAALEHEYAQECALHYAHQAARHAPADQQAQADAWCAAAADRLHQAVLAVRRTRAVMDTLEAQLATGVNQPADARTATTAAA